MLLDLPLAKKPPVLMLRVDLDAVSFEAVAAYDPKLWAEAEFYGWAGPNQMRREISPKFASFTKEEGETAKGEVSLAGWARLHAELVLINETVEEPLFQRASELLLKKHGDLLVAVSEAAKMQEAAKKEWVQRNKAQLAEGNPKGSSGEPPFRLLLCLDGIPLQEHKSYQRYRQIQYHAKRASNSEVLTDALGNQHTVLITSPGKHQGACLGSNISKSDRESCSWGYKQNTRMWIDDDGYMARLAGLETLVPSYTLRTGGGTNKAQFHIALVDTANTARIPLPELLAWAFNPKDKDDPSVWLPQEFRSLWRSTPKTAPVPTNPDLRLAIYWTENTCLRMVTYEPLDQSVLLRSIRQFRNHYGNIQIVSLVECLSAPQSERRTLTQAEAHRWIQRVLKGTPITLSEAMQALNRYLIELKTEHRRMFRTVAQTKILEDYMKDHPDTSPALYDVGVCVSKFASMAFETGQLNHQNDRKNTFAKRRKEQFVQRFMPLAVASPIQALPQMADKITMFIRAIPGQYHGKAAMFSSQRDIFMHSALADISTLAKNLTPLDRISVWKGYTDDQMERRQRWATMNENKGSEDKAPE